MVPEPGVADTLGVPPANRLHFRDLIYRAALAEGVEGFEADRIRTMIAVRMSQSRAPSLRDPATEPREADTDRAPVTP